jgi:hypothetical protein
MKSPTLFSALLSTVLAGIFTTARSTAQPKGERVTVTGEVVEMWCYLEAGDRARRRKRARRRAPRRKSDRPR